MGIQALGCRQSPLSGLSQRWSNSLHARPARARQLWSFTHFRNYLLRQHILKRTRILTSWPYRPVIARQKVTDFAALYRTISDRSTSISTQKMAGIRVAIDRGGTFCDVIAHIPGKEPITFKLLSEDPSNYRDAPTEAIRRVLEVAEGRKITPGHRLDASNIRESDCLTVLN